jgi:hypothetical protein
MAAAKRDDKNGGGGDKKRKRRHSPPHFICHQSEGASNQRVEMALNCWAMFPPPLPTSPSSAKKTIISQSRHASENEEQQQFWEQQLEKNLVPASKLPTVMPLDASRLVGNYHIGVTIRQREGGRVESVMASASIGTTTADIDDENSNKSLLGAIIRIKRGKFAGMIGKIIECIEGRASVTEKNVFKGKWYVTDNLKIANAFQEHTFDVLEYADGERNKKIDAVGDGGSCGDSSAVATRLGGETGVQIVPSKTEIAASAPTRTVENKSTVKRGVRGDVNDKQLKQGPASGTLRERSLIGATICINKGIYKGYTGVVRERMCVRRMQVDTVPVPLGLENVQVLQYPNTYTATASNDDDHRYNHDENHFQQKFLGAKVRCIANEYSGTLGTIIRVLNLGDWYITDNPKISTALLSNKFDVLKYVDVPVICIDDDDDDNVLNNDVKVDCRGKDDQEKNSAVVANDPLICIDDDDNDDKTKMNEKMDCRVKDDQEKNAAVRADDANVVGLCREKAADNDDFVDTAMVEQQTPPETNNAAVPLPTDNDQNRVSDDSEKGALPDGNDGEVTDDRDGDDIFKKIRVKQNHSNERSGAQTRGDHKMSATAKTKMIEVCSVKLPTIESIELAARLSAFDSFIFLADSHVKCGGGNLDSMRVRTDVVAANRGELSPTTSIQHINKEASTTCASTVNSTANTNGVHPRTTQTGCDNSNNECNANNTDALAKFIVDLIQLNQKSHNLPTARVIPGMEILMEEKQQPLRLVPLEERTVYLVPGSLEEGNELVKRLSVFDDYSFL